MPKQCEAKFSFSFHNNENEVNGEAGPAEQIFKLGGGGGRANA